ncbi:Co2+/Mg2+ efflux protein ApaG [Phreatobacter aquaticus]|uniref:Protein ApaG n=1 Tax=Phreatobacter aquaticus TaxID=2570229 RepID=A0A4D7QFU5_9HYPH|nr:Co2+/Mg2+ efflux protein ApaG [Phreatobacter aquaticus]QCK85795.1 Co2+/Mg2+ efflux protein ApaG [Phreatobacter aquaticus]
MYRSITRGIRITVTPQFLPERSSPDDNQYFWSYRVEIVNLSPDTVQLRTRYWHITDENGHVQEVRGPGVIGEQPVIEPGAAFEYTSGCPLATPTGIMVGHYGMVTDRDESFDAEIPAFSLDVPNAKRTMN